MFGSVMIFKIRNKTTAYALTSGDVRLCHIAR